jgi:hypothetical protein
MGESHRSCPSQSAATAHFSVKPFVCFMPSHAQLLTYLKLSNCRIGFLMNFHVAVFKQGLKRMVL